MRTHITLLALLACIMSASAQWQSSPEIAADYTRLTKTYTDPTTDTRLTLTVDFPDAYAPYSGEVNAWLVTLCNKAFLPGYSYGGSASDHQALGLFVAKKFFRFAKEEAQKDAATPSPYHYYYSMLVNTMAPGFVTYRLTTDLEIGQRHTMIGRQLVSFLYTGGEATNDVLFLKNKFKTVKETLLKTAYSDTSFMQSSLVKSQRISKWQDLRGIFSPEGNDGWDGMLLPPAALTEEGVTFSFSPATIGPEGNLWYHITVPYSALAKCFTAETSTAIAASYPTALEK